MKTKMNRILQLSLITLAILGSANNSAMAQTSLYDARNMAGVDSGSGSGSGSGAEYPTDSIALDSPYQGKSSFDGTLIDAQDVFPSDYNKDKNENGDEEGINDEPLNLTKVLARGVVKDTLRNSISELRYRAISEAAVAYGAQAGLAYQAKLNYKDLVNRASELDRLYQFQGLVIGSNVIPPVLIEVRDIYDQTDSDTLRLGKTYYKIVSQAHFSSNPPSWRTYLLRNYAANYDGDSGITPKSAAERALWERSVTEGWNRGAKQANLILREGWQLLQRDYLGMILYHTLLREGQVTQPYVSTTQTDIEGTPEEMTVGNTVLRIAAKPELVPNRSDWKGNAGKAPVGYVMPKPAGELKDSEPIKQYNPVYETPPK